MRTSRNRNMVTLINVFYGDVTINRHLIDCTAHPFWCQESFNLGCFDGNSCILKSAHNMCNNAMLQLFVRLYLSFQTCPYNIYSFFVQYHEYANVFKNGNISSEHIFIQISQKNNLQINLS